MKFSRAELDWIEAEWAYHLHGRSAFLSRDDFTQLVAWDDQGVPAEVVVNAMEAYFGRRSKQARPRTFIALKHLDKDVAKGMKLRLALSRAPVPEATQASTAWERVASPLREDPRARSAFETWRRLQADAPPPDHPGFLDHFDAERAALRQVVAIAEEALGPRREVLAGELQGRLLEAKLERDGPVWVRAWEHHWSRMVREACGITERADQA